MNYYKKKIKIKIKNSIYSQYFQNKFLGINYRQKNNTSHKIIENNTSAHTNYERRKHTPKREYISSMWDFINYNNKVSLEKNYRILFCFGLDENALGPCRREVNFFFFFKEQGRSTLHK